MSNTTTTTTADHAWILNATRCAFDRLYAEPVIKFNDERWANAHVLNRQRIKLGRLT